MNEAVGRSPGYTLPVFAVASAIAAYQCLQGESRTRVTVNLLNPPERVEIALEQVAILGENQALAITRSAPGDNLDLTRNTPIWALVERIRPGTGQLELRGGEGVGKDLEGKAAIYRYAQRLFAANLQPLILATEDAIATIILPEGRQLAQRTSNAAFGVVEGLSLLGTTGISQPLSAPGQLAAYQEELREKAQSYRDLVFCIGENGLNLAQTLGIEPQRLLKTANWLGPMLVAAARDRVQSLLLFGYHGKLIKLAGGIFHTHHHLADARLEILVACGVEVGLDLAVLREIQRCPTTEAALQYLRQIDPQGCDRLYQFIAGTIDRRSQAYIQKLSDRTVTVGSILFDRDRKIIVMSSQGTKLLTQLC
ncbi:MAG: cobalt-precorrin-5B (C(1))-methyltransferase CbiD [Jaaginema sp. PMC 1079.18]|nr:cobalt-precorrin-5B (C(1))-methyltransferase CbiD [Jaaginema sp. PMC 1080.18]MEC4850148.1 cobalt-precorrin-5B (C(1))-methyltransferase CbiD [Jaaginema sp. PMC 1079.18]MEC4866055.1 cobalt-precorrin-5B (C(1))-methyltransferase CbiD [Jaaginema sp. PMC 1078.18]